MKRNCSLAVIILALSALLLTACGKAEFGLSENTGKRMTITAEKADRNVFFMAGSLEVDEGEQIVISSDLTKGAVRVELVGTPEEQSIQELPDFNGEAVLTADVRAAEETSGTVPAGTYLLKTTCLERATGTVQIEVLPAS